MGREFELKYRADKAQLEEIAAVYGPFREIAMETTYYDAPSGVFSRLHWTLRRRLENGVSVVTLKTPLPDGSRGEWETRAPSLAEGLSALKAQGAPVPEAEGLTEICAARFTRLSRMLPIPDGRAELALDRGVLRGTREEAPLLELELELKEGPDEALTAFAREFAGKYGLSEEPQSKFARASRLR